MSIETRPGTIADACDCAKVVNDWIAETDWLKGPPVETVIDALARGIEMREFWVAGEPVFGYLSFNAEDNQIMGLYCASRCKGVGKTLMDRVKEGRDFVQLWSHAVNLPAHKFYRREGFVQTDTKAEGADGIPEIKMEWRRAR